MVGNLKDKFSCKESLIFSLSELHVSSQTTYVINTDITISLADFTAFFQDERKSIKRVENRYKSC